MSGLSDRVYAGRLQKDGKVWREGQQWDVTDDFLKTVVAFVGPGKSRVVNVDGKPKYRITVEKIP
jgi:hypothetical protein